MKKNYLNNRQPLMETPFLELPLGAVKADKWLRTQLNLMAEGLTGNLEEIWEDVGSNSGWLGGSGENWERGPYYLDGLIPLAYILEDNELIKKSQKWIEWTLNSQREDGYFGPADNEDWWPRMVMLKVLKQYYEATNDNRIIEFMTRYFNYQNRNIHDKPLNMWGKARGAENLIVIYWLYNHTGDDFLLELAKTIFEQTLDWTTFFEDIPFKESMKNILPWKDFTDIGWEKILKEDGLTKKEAEELFNKYHLSHIVNVAMGIKEPVVFYQQSGDSRGKECIEQGIKDLKKYHGVVYGMFTGDEHLSGNKPTQGTELCAVVEYMYSLENIIRILGHGVYGDILEKVTYNALPATLTSDFKQHQYLQQANQVVCSNKKREWYNNENDSNIYGLEPNFGCCTANMHQGWPKFIKSMWMATDDNGLAAIAYGPCTVTAKVADCVEISIKEETDYPFKDTVALKIITEEKVKFPLKLRMPGWVKNPRLYINDKEVKIEEKNGFCIIDREWNKDDKLKLILPMEINIASFPYNSYGIERGPLVYGLKIEEEWRKLKDRETYSDWEIYPKTNWNYGLMTDTDNIEDSFKIIEKDIGGQPFQSKNPPVTLLVRGMKIKNWELKDNSADVIPDELSLDRVDKEISLIPYGCTNIRIAQIPLIKK